MTEEPVIEYARPTGGSAREDASTISVTYFPFTEGNQYESYNDHGVCWARYQR